MPYETPFDVLKTSIQLHPSTFADACQNEANDDWRYIARRLDMPEHARRCAVACAEALTFAAYAARNHVDPGHAANAIMERFAGSWVAAYMVAARLLCIPRGLVAEIADRA